MQNGQRMYIAIDLKSFYASVECAAKDLDPLDANLVVADPSRTEKTICLAVSPSLKSYGIPGRARLFEVIQRVKEVNSERRKKAPGRRFSGRSCFGHELKNDPSLELDYIVAPPRMAEYMRVSTEIYKIYLRYIAPEDIHVYSIDEVFIDATDYLKTYRLSAHGLAIKLIREVLNETGITATVGIGTNLYLANDERTCNKASTKYSEEKERKWAARLSKEFTDFCGLRLVYCGYAPSIGIVYPGGGFSEKIERWFYQ